MGKPETKPAQSLEEILASIRKALAEEEVQGPADRLDLPEPAPPAEGRPASAKGDALPGQLAVALNGSGSREPAVDDDLAELLAPLPSKEPIKEPAKEPSAAAASASPSEPATGEKKDPLWFLARQPAAKSEPVLEEKPEEPPAEEVAAVSIEEAALTRLEALRSALPPLFGSGEGPAIKTEPVAFAQPAVLKPAELPEFPLLQKPKEEAREAKAPLPEKAPVAQEAQPEPVVAQPAPSPPPPTAVVPPPAPAPEPPAVETAAPVPPEPRPTGMASAQSRALEEMIGQLIEPVIRNWLDANLARLVEKVVREEVARAGKPDRPKKD